MSLLFIVNHFAVDLYTKAYLLHNIEHETPLYVKLLAEIRKDIRIIAGEELIFLIATYVMLLFSSIATFCASALTYASNHLTLNEFFSRFGRTWKRPVITYLYNTVSSLGYLLLSVVLIVLLYVMESGGSLALVALGVILAIFARIYCSPYPSSLVRTLGLVISVVEEGCYGIEMSDVINTEATRIVMGLVLINIAGLVSLYTSVVTTVFYYGCKKSHGEEVEVQRAMSYIMLPANVGIP
ncbi:uncharacterized protein LOC143878717 [Tasmannia lanceolata]|uniref:uncharacterized protein LOC143878717 n=1 Tax=Tasmannia lanceolata TaxID=3420 RepID=UPI0040638006